ncbi:MAG: PASTA domain-containing protein, partial [Ruminococcaceae bacterium]|nr:PASTA domain-containing protein [Oscillospiraceae bacterium]
MDLFEKYVGLVFDNRYRIEQVIGIGGMAVVFKATDLLMRRTVAVKILKDEISGDEQSVKRFINESKAVAMLSHQNIVNIYDVSVRENIKYIVMEYVDGITLKSYMQHREVLNLREIISYTTQILRALDHAHKKGIVHRDIKPQNIMLLKNGIIKVMDFGIAKLPNAETITMTDKAIGTVFYISPEQVTGGDIDARSDLYSLGTLMYEMATGRLPFTAETPVSVALMQVNEEADLPRDINSHIPYGLEQIIMRAMEKDPEERYQSAGEMLSQLLKLRENPKIIFKEKTKAVKKQKQKKHSSKPRRRTSKSMFPIIMGVTLAFLIAAGISVYYMVDKLFISGSLNNYISINVEKFVDATYSEELADWFKASSYYQVPEVNYVYHDTVPEGTIISQTPAPNESRKVLPGKQKCSIILEVSKGQHTMTLSDYTVKDYRVVSDELRKLGLKVKVENVTSDIYEIGYVIKTEPKAGTVVKENDLITIYVSRGATTVNTTVPNFVGLSEAQTIIKLMDSNLTIGNVEYVKSDKAVGSVVSQSVEAWYEVPKYTEIDFTVSGGPSYSGDGTTIPTASDMKPSTTRPVVTPTVPDDDETETDREPDNDDWWDG